MRAVLILSSRSAGGSLLVTCFTGKALKQLAFGRARVLQLTLTTEFLRQEVADNSKATRYKGSVQNGLHKHLQSL